MPDTFTQAADPDAEAGIRGRPRRVAVVANGRAGALLADPGAEATLEAQFAAAGLVPHFVPPQAGTLPQRIAAACALGVDAVVVAGGDGTVACAAQNLLGTAMPLGILPFGTMNLLAKDLGIPVGNTAAAVALLRDGAARPIDAGQVNGHVFLCASMLGLPARLARHRERGRQRPALIGWGRFAIAAVRALWRGRRLRLALVSGARERRLAAHALTLTVNPLGKTPHAFGRPRLDGGRFGVYVVIRLRLRDLPRLAWRAARGRVEPDASVQVATATRLVVGSERAALRVMNDGEVRLIRPPLRYRIRPGALLVIAPAAGEPAA